jgi:hypothetical protein
MIIPLETQAEITAEELADKMRIEDIGALLSAVAKKLDGDYVNRAYCVTQFESEMTEEGARFLAEIITTRFAKKK